MCRTAVSRRTFCTVGRVLAWPAWRLSCRLLWEASCCSPQTIHPVQIVNNIPAHPRARTVTCMHACNCQPHAHTHCCSHACHATNQGMRRGRETMRDARVVFGTARACYRACLSDACCGTYWAAATWPCQRCTQARTCCTVRAKINVAGMVPPASSLPATVASCRRL